MCKWKLLFVCDGLYVGLPTVLYFKGQSYIGTPRPCPLLNLELSFISRAEKNLLQERKKFAKVQSNCGCVAQPMENRVLTFFFLFFVWRPPCPRAVFLRPPKKKCQHLITHPDKNRGSPIKDCPLQYRTVGNSGHSVLY